jgi:hypothetical protein
MSAKQKVPALLFDASARSKIKIRNAAIFAMLRWVKSV